MAARSFETEQLRNYRPCWKAEEVVQVLADLERLSECEVSKPSFQRRDYERKAYTSPVMLAQSRTITLPDGTRAMLHAIARNLSQSGLAVVAPRIFEAEQPCREAPSIRSDKVFRDGAVLEIGLRKPGFRLLWLYGTVIRARIVKHDYIDVGIRFNARINVVQELELE